MKDNLICQNEIIEALDYDNLSRRNIKGMSAFRKKIEQLKCIVEELNGLDELKNNSQIQPLQLIKCYLKYYRISLEASDFNHFISILFSNEEFYIDIIHTSLVQSDDSNGIDKYNLVDIKIAHIKSANINLKHTYSKKELKELIEGNKIIFLKSCIIHRQVSYDKYEKAFRNGEDLTELVPLFPTLYVRDMNLEYYKQLIPEIVKFLLTIDTKSDSIKMSQKFVECTKYLKKKCIQEIDYYKQVVEQYQQIVTECSKANIKTL